MRPRADQKTFFPPFFVSFLSHSYPFRVRYQLQMLKPISTVFVTEQLHWNLPFRVLSATRSTETWDTDQSPGNYRTLPVIINPFDTTLFLTQQNSSYDIASLKMSEKITAALKNIFIFSTFRLSMQPFSRDIDSTSDEEDERSHNHNHERCCI